MVQLQYSGMCAALVLMQAGFPTRVSFDELYSRYASKMPGTCSGGSHARESPLFDDCTGVMIPTYYIPGIVSATTNTDALVAVLI